MMYRPIKKFITFMFIHIDFLRRLLEFDFDIYEKLYTVIVHNMYYKWYLRYITRTVRAKKSYTFLLFLYFEKIV